MKSVFEDFLLMIQFFTRVPIKKNLPCEPKNFKQGVVFLPFIGLLIGAMQYGIVYMFKANLPSSILAAMVVLLPIMITGGLHIDGLGDTCDGFFAFTQDKHRIIEIMKDSHAGTFAICAIIGDILLQYGAMVYLIDQESAHVFLVIIMFSKLFVLVTGLLGVPAKEAGSGNLFVGNMSWVIFMISVMYSVLIGSFVIGFGVSLILLFSGLIGTLLFYWLCFAKIEGVTGDTFGALQELTTVIMLIVYVTTI